MKKKKKKPKPLEDKKKPSGLVFRFYEAYMYAVEKKGKKYERITEKDG